MRADGAIAYFKGDNTHFRAGEPFLGEILVRPQVSAPPEQWTEEPARYVAVAWAGRTLLAYGGLEGEGEDVLALDRPGQIRTLAAEAFLVAVSPDGARAIVVPQNSVPPVAELVDVSNGDTLDTLVLGDRQEPNQVDPGILAYAGSWLGNQVAAESQHGIVVLGVNGDSLSLESFLMFRSNEFPIMPHEPQLIDNGARVVGWVPIPGEGGEAKGRLYEYVDCDIASGSCLEGPPRGDRFFHPVYSPSADGGSS
jgi:hypothetical protein